MTDDVRAHHDVALEPGSLVNDRYEISSAIGAGGFAVVFKAFDRVIERDVAIKVLNLPAMGQPTAVDTLLKRFQREARLAAKIRHRCVVQIFDFGVLDTGRHPFIIMELLEGHDLESELGIHGPMDPMRALPLFCDTLDALGEAHGLGIVHKDLKPSNLFLATTGGGRESLRLVDFGIAHIGEASNARLTATGYMLGTPQYMAPEYVEAQIVSPALDVYQMGLIFVEMLSGRPVVDHENPWRCAIMHASRELIIPQSLLDGPLGSILDTAMAFDPADRFAEATAFSEALRRIDPSTIMRITSNEPYRKIGVTSAEVAPGHRQTGERTRPITEEQAFQRTLEQFPQAAQSLSAAPDHRPSAAPKAAQNAAQNVMPTASIGAADSQRTHALDALQPDAPSTAIATRTMLTLAIVLMLLVGAAIASLWVINQPVAEPLAENIEAAEAIAAVEEVADVVANLAIVEAAPAPVIVTVRVLSEPAGASIYRADTLLGVAPVNIDFSQDESGPLELVARLAGHSDTALTLRAGDGPDAVIRLSAQAKVAPRERAPQPRKFEPKVEPKPKPRMQFVP
ncbi:MAG: serine/threonine protein kinase [Bradymonadaceae bacterium]|nr:serine/threonine protein kinase [Lujinxingiaceae bacterium]